MANAESPLPEDLACLTEIIEAVGRTAEQFADDVEAYKSAAAQQTVHDANADPAAVVAETAALRQKRDALRRQAELDLKDLERAIHDSEQRHTQRANAAASLLRVARERPHLFDCTDPARPALIVPPAAASGK